MYVLKKDFATVEIDCEKSLLVITWHRQTTDEEFKEAYMLSLQTALEKELRFFLSDNSTGISLVLALQHWVAAFGAGIIKNLKLERCARVVPPDAFQEIVSYKMFDYITQLDHGEMEFKVFYSKEEARKWLLQG